MLLTDHFIQRLAHKIGKGITGISEQALALLCRYGWPGNVRQLEHAIERACILCQDTTISSEHLPEEIVQEIRPGQSESLSSRGGIEGAPAAPIHHFTLSEQDQQITEKILAALQKAGGNKAKAARLLNIDRSTLYRKLRELHIDRDMLAC